MSSMILVMKIWIKNEITMNNECPFDVVIASGHMPIISDKFFTYTDITTKGMVAIPIRNVLRIEYGKFDLEDELFTPSAAASQV